MKTTAPGRRFLLYLVPCLLASFVLLVYPVYVIRPFRAQGVRELSAALAVTRYRPLLMVAAAATALVALIWYWRRERRLFRRIAALAATLAVAAMALASRVNIYELMFHPLGPPDFMAAGQSKLDGDEMVIAIRVGQVARAYPIRNISYYHIVNDLVDGVPIVATYWTLCHTGLVWRADVDGLRLRFHLAGINDQNFLMRDEETGSYWQQITGAAVSGPLAGKRLTLVASDELAFATWKAEEPQGTVLRERAADISLYSKKDWDVRMLRAPVVIAYPESGLAPRELMVGLHGFGASRAFPYDALLKDKVIQDHLGSEPVLLVLGEDGHSVRVFRRRIPGAATAPDFYRVLPGQSATPAALLMDSATGSEWNFQGCAVSGKSSGVCLERVESIKDYWFDWRHFNPATTVYRAKR